MVTPAYEDSGLFKKPTTELIVNLIPKFGKNSRHDIIIKGLMPNGVEIDVIFAGRRKRYAEELVALLKQKWAGAHRLTKGMTPPRRRDVFVPTRLYGSWRSRVAEDAQDLTRVEHQFLAARWAYHSHQGDARTCGELPYAELRLRAKTGQSRNR